MSKITETARTLEPYFTDEEKATLWENISQIEEAGLGDNDIFTLDADKVKADFDADTTLKAMQDWEKEPEPTALTHSVMICIRLFYKATLGLLRDALLRKLAPVLTPEETTELEELTRELQEKQILIITEHNGIVNANIRSEYIFSEEDDAIARRYKDFLSELLERLRGELKALGMEEPQLNFLPMLHGKATDAMATMAGKKASINEISGAGAYESQQVKLIIQEFSELAGTLGVSTHKLLSTGVAFFTDRNHVGNSKRILDMLRVAIPLKEYAQYCGYDVTPHDDTPEEAKRADDALRNARKKIRKDINILLASTLTWEEKVRGKVRDFDSMHILGRGGIRSGYINLEFTQSMGEYLIQLPLTQYPVALLGVDERNTNAYSLGLAMAEHFNMDNNQRKGTANTLKVKTLLGYTNLPSYESIKGKKSWGERLKEPLETSLDVLTQCGLLSDWRYSGINGTILTDEEATNFSSYEEWADTNIFYVLKDAPDHTPRLEARAEERKQRAVKKKSSSSKKKG